MMMSEQLGTGHLLSLNVERLSSAREQQVPWAPLSRAQYPVMNKAAVDSLRWQWVMGGLDITWRRSAGLDNLRKNFTYHVYAHHRIRPHMYVPRSSEAS